MKDEHSKDNFVDVLVITTSGSYPNQGFDKTPIRQKLEVILRRAVAELGIVSTKNWIAKVNGGTSPVDTSQSYLDLGLSGEVKIDYGPKAGGGG